MDFQPSTEPTNPSPYLVLIIGGYGNFGRRISSTLVQDSEIQIIIAGRNLHKAEQLRSELSPSAEHPPIAMQLDIQADDFAEQLKQSAAQLVIHTSGPFQAQGYDVAKHCIEQGKHYIDLADGREFVTGFTALDTSAKNNAVLAITGASSVPGLSSAVIEHYRDHFKTIDTLHYGIAPGNQTERGEATVKAILSYSGHTYPCWENNRWQDVYGWQNLHKHDFPHPIGSRWLSNCEIPDLSLFKEHYPELRTIRFYAGLELSLLHLGLWSLTALVRIGLVKNLAHYASLLTRMSRWVEPLGSDVGGMYIRLAGKDKHDRPLVLNWDLIAKSGDGPYIPTIAAIILAKKFARGKLDQTGAVPCIDIFSLCEFTEEVRSWDIYQEIKLT